MSGVLIVAGPTAVGKTALAIELAERFGAEIIGADARQIYRGMPIGTSAPTAAERARVRHHLVGFLGPYERYSAARFAADAQRAVADVSARGRRVLVVGGTGFYIRALCGDVRLAGAYDPRVRARLARESRLHPPEVLHAWLAARDPARARSLAPTDRYRVARALEVVLAENASTADDGLRAGSLREAGVPFAKAFVDLDDATLEERIRARVERMLTAGLVDEAERIGSSAVAADAVGYPQALAYARGWCTSGELRELLVRETRRYAKRQRTWFRREPGVVWLPACDGGSALAQFARDVLGWK